MTLSSRLRGDDFAGFAGACGAWGLVDGVFEMLVSESAFAAFGDDDRLARAQVCELLAGVFIHDDGACGYADDAIGSVCSGALFAPAAIAVLGFPIVDASEIDQGIEPFVYGEDDVAAFSAVAAVGSTFGYTFGSFEGYFTVTAVAGGDLNSCAIYEHSGDRSSLWGDGGEECAEVDQSTVFV